MIKLINDYYIDTNLIENNKENINEEYLLFN